ncbi:MAG: carboxypeptidase regulatory-like domain-containing protein [Vicinamibacteria bacterium]|nr:carboxypeptidase regulatory-like domain-containing protein [Vicinamibacteria bacterium]
MKRAWTLVCLGLLLAAPLATAQVVTTGTVVVVVEASDGSRLPGALVTASAPDVTTRRTAVTDARGEAVLVNLAPSAAYAVTTELSGFSSVKNPKVLVRSGQTTTLRVGLALSSQTEEITVTAESPLVDTTSAVTGQDITLELTESLPTGRSYQSYLQLVPGVMPSDSGNPASKSGLNYSDIGGTIGSSADNFYYFDGINVTDPVTGTFGANLNTEIIQEQQVLTGGLSAEFVGTPGLLSNVITKSGSNTWHGSANYFFQNDGLVGENENSANAAFNTFDTALTLGGPIVRDRLWFFASYRRVERDDDVTSLDTNQLLRTVTNSQDQTYAKLTWAPTDKDTLSVTWMGDPTDITGSSSRSITNARDRSTTQGGNRYSVNYSRLLGSAVLDLGYNKHNGEVSTFSVIRESANTIVFRRTDSRTLADEQKGGFGSDNIDQRDTETYRAALQWNTGRHTIKAGGEFLDNASFRNALTIGDTKSGYTSLTNGLSGITAQGVATGSLTGLVFDPTNASDFNGFIATINGLPNRSAFYSAYDTNRDGVISQAELGAALVFNSTAGNPHGAINYSRTFQSADGPQDLGSHGLSFFAQDTANFGRLSVNAGVRAERFRHFNTLGEEIYTFDWTLAPRASLVYDVKGDGRQKLSAFYGRYYDPIRNNMTQFAGSHSGRTREEQVFANGQWVTYRVRGGASLDAIFAPETKTPYTDDIQVAYEIDLGNSLAVQALFTKRWTRNILEDYDPVLYSDPAHYPGPTDHPDSLFLPYTHFGFDASGLPGAANFFIGTLEGGKRDYQGIELTIRRRFKDRWQALASYTFNDAEGNSNSDSNADFQGDVLFLDPRAPNQYGKQPGSIEHLFKIAASYQFDMGLQLGAFYRWNSGSLASRTFLASGRNLPIRVDASQTFEFAGIDTRWIAPDTVGTLTNPSFGLLDVRVEYNRRFGNVMGELFVDVFNLLDSQGSTRNQDLVAGSGGIAFGQPIAFNSPRRFFLGARVSF